MDYSKFISFEHECDAKPVDREHSVYADHGFALSDCQNEDVCSSLYSSTKTPMTNKDDISNVGSGMDSEVKITQAAEPANSDTPTPTTQGFEVRKVYKGNSSDKDIRKSSKNNQVMIKNLYRATLRYLNELFHHKFDEALTSKLGIDQSLDVMQKYAEHLSAMKGHSSPELSSINMGHVYTGLLHMMDSSKVKRCSTNFPKLSHHIKHCKKNFARKKFLNLMAIDPFRVTMRYLKATGVLKLIVNEYPSLNKIAQDYELLIDAEF